MELVGLWSKTTVSVSGTLTQRIMQLADRQRGIVSCLQLLMIGVSASSVDRLLSKGWLRRVHAGVYAVGHRVAVSLARETAALLSLRDGAVLSHHNAAILWGLRSPKSDDGQVHALVPGNGRPGRLTGVCPHRTAILDRADVRVHDGLPLTAPARTVLDLAPELGDRAVEVTLDQGIVKHLISEPERAQLRARCAGRPGCARLAVLLDRQHGTTLTGSEAEELFLSLVRRADLPAPQINQRWRGRERDFFWPEGQLLGEIDGWAFHRTRRSFEDDRRRDAKARAAGRGTMRITPRQLHDEPLRGDRAACSGAREPRARS
ncbi:MAG: type IV toxin-antitoxin system AbiEi family antitoxin domain-containing protein [Solirubrobacteraceae bacterium]